MALQDAIVFQDLFSCNNSRNVYNLLGGDNNWNSSDHVDLTQPTQNKFHTLDIIENQAQNLPYTASPLSLVLEPHNLEQWGCNSLIQHPEIISLGCGDQLQPPETSTTMACRPKRRRSRSKKNIDDIENQRMTHIAVERNRRKQMNEYLSLLRSLMPESYVQRESKCRIGRQYELDFQSVTQNATKLLPYAHTLPKVDQASIVAGAIKYVKKLEHKLQLLSGQTLGGVGTSSSPFAEFFSFPQYTTSSSTGEDVIAAAHNSNASAAMADIEVNMVESHANLKIRSKKRPRQLLKMMNGLQSLRLTILHLTVSTADQIVLYSMCVKMEDDCKLNSGEEIATSVDLILARIQVEATLFHA